MNLGAFLDGLLISVIVLLCALYVLYALSSVAFKRKLLSLFVKVVGLRIFGWLSPNPTGCDHCGSVRPKWPSKPKSTPPQR